MLLLYLTHYLSSNDGNKEDIVQHGGVPVLTAILRPDYTDDEKRAAISVLQKLASLESNCDAIKTHVTATYAVQGTYNYLANILFSRNMFTSLKNNYVTLWMYDCIWVFKTI